MKKALIATVALLVLVIAIVFGIKVMVFPPELVIMKILPEEVSFYYSVQDLESMWEVVKTSNFWRKFSQLKLWDDIQIQARLRDIQNHFRENAGIELTEANFLKLAGRELAIAIIAPRSLAGFPDTLLLARGKDRQDLLNIVNPAIERIKRKESILIEDIQYKGKEIIHIKPAAEEQPDTYFTLLGNVLIVGIGKTPASLKKVIDISTGEEKKSLAVSEKYQKLAPFISTRRNVASVFLLDFVEMQRYFERFLGIPGYEMSSAQPLVNAPVISCIGGWTKIKEGLVTKLYIYPQKECFTPEMKQIWEIKPKVLETLRFTPEKVLLYIAYGTLDVSNMWDVWMENLRAQAESHEKTQRILAGIENFERDWDISIINNILPLLGEEIAFVFSDISIKAFMPVPELGLVLKITDKVKMENLIKHLVKKNNEKAELEAKKRKEMMEMRNTIEDVGEFLKGMEWLMKKSDEMPEMLAIVKKLEAVEEMSEQMEILEKIKGWDETPEKREIMEKLKDFIQMTERIKGQEEMIEKMEDYKYVPPTFRFRKIDLTEETYEGCTIKALQIPVEGIGLVPGYTFIDNFLLIGATTETVREMIDVKKDKVKALSQDTAYRQLTDILPSKNNQMSFVNMERLADVGIKISELIVDFQRLAMPLGPPPENPVELESFNQQRMRAEATIAMIQEHVIPILRILKSIKTITTASINKRDHIEYTLILKAEDI